MSQKKHWVTAEWATFDFLLTTLASSSSSLSSALSASYLCLAFYYSTVQCCSCRQVHLHKVWAGRELRKLDSCCEFTCQLHSCCQESTNWNLSPSALPCVSVVTSAATLAAVTSLRYVLSDPCPLLEFAWLHIAWLVVLLRLRFTQLMQTPHVIPWSNINNFGQVNQHKGHTVMHLDASR